MKTYYVYSRGNTGHAIILTTDFSGSRWECQKFYRDLVRSGRMTTYTYISCLSFDKAQRKFLP